MCAVHNEYQPDWSRTCNNINESAADLCQTILEHANMTAIMPVKIPSQTAIILLPFYYINVHN